MFIRWDKTVDSYAVRLKLLAGVPLTELEAAHPETRGMLYSFAKDRWVCTVAAVNKLRAKALCATSNEQLKGIVISASALLSVYPDTFSVNLSVDPSMLVQINKRGVVHALKCMASWAFYSVQYSFPCFIPAEYLRELVCGTDTLDTDLCDALLPGAYINIPKEHERVLKNDKALFEYIYAKHGEKVVWPDSFKERMRFFVDTEYNLSRRRLRILIDGENFSPADAYIFLENYLYVPHGMSVKVVVFTPEQFASKWQSFAIRAKCKTKVVPCEHLLERKSNTDLLLTQYANRKYYVDGHRDFCILSSDSDFAVLRESLPEARISYVVNPRDVASAWLTKMREENIQHCILDNSTSALNNRLFEIEHWADCAINSGIDPSVESEWEAFRKTIPDYVSHSVISRAQKRAVTRLANINRRKESKDDGC